MKDSGLYLVHVRECLIKINSYLPNGKADFMENQIVFFLWERLAMMLEVDRQVSLAFYQRLQKVVAVLEMKVFGSRARGDATFDSDLDVFIKVDTMDRSVRKKIIDVAWEVGFEHDRVISTFIVTEQQLKTGAVGASPLMAKITQEGIKI